MAFSFVLLMVSAQFSAASSITVGTCASAAPFVDASNRVSNNIGCEYANGFANFGGNPYDNVFFGGGWTEIDRDNGALDSSGALQGSGSTLGGNYGVFAPGYDMFVLVFKSANESNTAPGVAVAYLLDSVQAGSFLTPFAKTNGKCDGTTYVKCERDISHWALLGKNTGTPQVPLPAGLPLLAAGVLAFGALRSRKS
jgi:hypothetical protein